MGGVTAVQVWIKIVASWVCYVLYGWVMLAPPACPDRDFTGVGQARRWVASTTSQRGSLLMIGCSARGADRVCSQCGEHRRSRAHPLDKLLRRLSLPQV